MRGLQLLQYRPQEAREMYWRGQDRVCLGPVLRLMLITNACLRSFKGRALHRPCERCCKLPVVYDIAIPTVSRYLNLLTW